MVAPLPPNITKEAGIPDWGGRLVLQLQAGFSSFASAISTAITNGVVASAAKWTTARVLSFTGDVTGSSSVDGSANVATAMTLATAQTSAHTWSANQEFGALVSVGALSTPVKPLHVWGAASSEIQIEATNGLTNYRAWNLDVDGGSGAKQNLTIRLLTDTGLSVQLTGIVISGTTGLVSAPNGVSVGTATLLSSSVALTNGAGSSVGTLSNAPAVGNPTKWISINDNGTVRQIPAW